MALPASGSIAAVASRGCALLLQQAGALSLLSGSSSHVVVQLAAASGGGRRYDPRVRRPPAYLALDPGTPEADKQQQEQQLRLRQVAGELAMAHVRPLGLSAAALVAMHQHQLPPWGPAVGLQWQQRHHLSTFRRFLSVRARVLALIGAASAHGHARGTSMRYHKLTLIRHAGLATAAQVTWAGCCRRGCSACRLPTAARAARQLGATSQHPYHPAGAPALGKGAVCDAGAMCITDMRSRMLSPATAGHHGFIKRHREGLYGAFTLPGIPAWSHQ
jgi:hypothetical protein